MEPLKLVRPELRGHIPGQVRHNAGLYFPGAPLDLLRLLFWQETFGGLVRQLQCMQSLWFVRQFTRIEPKSGQPLVLLIAEVVMKPAPTFSF